MNRLFKNAASLLLAGLLPASAAFAASDPVTITPGQPIYLADDLFTSRDLRQTAKTSDAVSLALEDGKDLHIKEEGVYLLSGEAKNVTVYIEAGTEDKVQLVLDGVSIENEDRPCICAVQA